MVMRAVNGVILGGQVALIGLGNRNVGRRS
jgi:hypothetical protein